MAGQVLQSSGWMCSKFGKVIVKAGQSFMEFGKIPAESGSMILNQEIFKQAVNIFIVKTDEGRRVLMK